MIRGIRGCDTRSSESSGRTYALAGHRSVRWQITCRGTRPLNVAVAVLDVAQVHRSRTTFSGEFRSVVPAQVFGPPSGLSIDLSNRMMVSSA